MILTQTSSNWLIALFQHQWRWQDFSSYPTLMSLSGTWSQYFNFKWYHLLPNVYLISVLLIPVNIVNKKQNLVDNQKSTQNNWKQSFLWTCLNLIDLFSAIGHLWWSFCECTPGISWGARTFAPAVSPVMARLASDQRLRFRDFANYTVEISWS